MEDLIKGIEWLNIPRALAISIVALFLISQVIGKIIEAFGKTAPELLRITKLIQRKRQEKKETAETLVEVKKLLSDVNSHYSTDNITKRNAWMSQVDTNISTNDKLVSTLEEKIDKILDTNEQLKKDIGQVKSNVLENEADRLRSELFDCGNRCRRKIRLHPEEMDHIRDVFKKYSVVLHQNGTGEAEFNFITNYYNNQDFPEYHERQGK